MPPLLLEAPVEGTVFKVGDQVVLRWKPVPDLPEDAYYALTVAYCQDGVMWVDDTPWVQTNTWELSLHAGLPQMSDDGLFRWTVRVMRQVAVDPETGWPLGIALSEPSEVWSFRWNED